MQESKISMWIHPDRRIPNPLRDQAVTNLFIVICNLTELLLRSHFGVMLVESDNRFNAHEEVLYPIMFVWRMDGVGIQAKTHHYAIDT